MIVARLLLFGFITLFTAQTLAEEETRWYQVELIIFENKNLADAEMEVWPENPGAPDLRGIGTLNSPPAGFEILDRSELQLGGAKTHLARSGKYAPILHFAWRQPGLAKEIAVPLRVQGGLRYVTSAPLETGIPSSIDTDALEQSSGDGAVTSGLGDAIDTTARFVPQEVSQIDGTLKLILGRYLHLHTDLIYRRMVPAGALRTSGGRTSTLEEAVPATGSKVMSFRMQQQRKMRSKELHYIDHPLFGIVLKVLPVEPGSEEPA